MKRMNLILLVCRIQITQKISRPGEAPVAAKSKMQESVALSVTEAELVAATHCYREMMYV
jgi:hypothetical protein